MYLTRIIQNSSRNMLQCPVEEIMIVIVASTRAQGQHLTLKLGIFIGDHATTAGRCYLVQLDADLWTCSSRGVSFDLQTVTAGTSSP